MNSVHLDDSQFQVLIDSANQLNLLTNRVEFLLLLNVVMLGIFIYKLMRSK